MMENYPIYLIKSGLKDENDDYDDNELILANDETFKNVKRKFYTWLKKCNYCNLQFRSYSDLMIHKKVSHNIITEEQVMSNISNSKHKELADEIDDKTSETESGLSNYNTPENLCFICLEQFEYREVLRFHIAAVHLNNKPYECDKCHFRTLLMDKLNEHKLSHIDLTDALSKEEKEQPMTISKPTITYSKVFVGENDIKSEDEKKSTPTAPVIQCKICLIEFINHQALNEHYKLKHNKNLNKIKFDKINLEIKLPICPICSEIFSYNYHFTQHMKKVHNLYHRSSIRCEKCSSIFSCLRSLQRHRTRACYSLTCDSCNKVFDHRFDFLRHMETHDKAGPLKLQRRRRKRRQLGESVSIQKDNSALSDWVPLEKITDTR